MQSISIFFYKVKFFPWWTEVPSCSSLYVPWDLLKAAHGRQICEQCHNYLFASFIKRICEKWGGRQAGRGEVQAGLRERTQGRGQATLQEESWQQKKRERTLEKRGKKCHFLYSVPENLSVQFSCMLYYTDLSISPRAGLHRRNPLGPCQCTPQSLPSAKHNTFHIG